MLDLFQFTRVLFSTSCQNFFFWLWKWVAKCWTIICRKYLCNLFFYLFYQQTLFFYLMTFKIFSIKKFLQYYLQVFKRWIFFFNIANFYFFFYLTQLKAMKYYSVINKNCSVKEKPFLFMCCLFLWNYLNNISKILFPHSNLLCFHSSISLLPFYFSLLWLINLYSL